MTAQTPSMSAIPPVDAAPAVRSSKRKRGQVSYLQDDYFDELEVKEPEHLEEIDSEPDEAYGRKRSTKKPVKKKAKRAPKPKKFKALPFMELSAELRNEIYELALTEEDGITLVTQTSGYRRTASRGTIVAETGDLYRGKKRKTGGFGGYWGYQRGGTTTKETIGEADRKLTPNLLAVSKQIREEGSSILYKQELIFEDMITLHAFVMQIGPYNQKLVSQLTVKSWSDNSNVAKGYNFSGLCALAMCTNLQTLYFDCSLGWYKSPEKLARQLYRDGHYFFDALVAAHGSIDAAVQVIDVCEWHFDKNPKNYNRNKEQGVVYDPAKEQAFRTELRWLIK